MNRDEILVLLRTHKPVLMERFGVTALALFGSYARDQASDSSDVDILVQIWTGPLRIGGRYFGTQFYLEDLLGRRPVDYGRPMEELRVRRFRPYVEHGGPEMSDYGKCLMLEDAPEETSNWRLLRSGYAGLWQRRSWSIRNGLDEDAFVADDSLVVRCHAAQHPELIGEAATHVPVKVR